ncbi:Growth-regulating factor 5-like protein [Drosera capensis]
MKEERGCCTGRSGTAEVGVSMKGYQDGKCGVVELGLKVEEVTPASPFLCNQAAGGGVGGGGCCVDGKRPTFKEMGTAYLSNTCHFSAGDTNTVPVAIPIAATAPGDDGLTGPAATVMSHLQPFDISHSSYNSPFFKSPGGGGMATPLGVFPFTAAQWKELQRQAMVYKYMVACVPVPHDLLFPIDPPGSASSWEKMGMFNVRWTGNGKDVEPGRCRRTDGKKWRCSKDVAPNQKYCERHLNRGRPRSRKPVEIHAGFPINSPKNSAKKDTGAVQNSSFNLLNLKNEANDSSSESGHLGVGCSAQGLNVNQSDEVRWGCAFDCRNIRGLKRMSKDEGPVPQWQQVGRSVGSAPYPWFNDTNSSMFQHSFDNEPIDSTSYLNFNSDKANPVGQSWCLDSISTPARGFIDAWSNGLPGSNNENSSRQRSSVSSNGEISASSLALSMGGSNLNDDEICRIQMGHGGGIDSAGNIGDHMSSWTNPGGPLAEALGSQPVSTADLARDSIFPNPRNGALVTPPSTTVSSPSGVLQKTFASFSDSSGGNSPICEERKPMSQIPFQWLR